MGKVTVQVELNGTWDSMAFEYDSTQLAKEMMEAVRRLPAPPPCPVSLQVGLIVEALRRGDDYAWNSKIPHFKCCGDCQREIDRIHKYRPIKLGKKRPVVDALLTAFIAATACVTYATMRDNHE